MEQIDCFLNNIYAHFLQGLNYDEENLKIQAIEMYEKGLALFEEANKLNSITSHKLYDGLVKTKEQAQQRLYDLKQKIETDTSDKLINIRETLKSNWANDAELIYWLPDGVQLVIINNDLTYAPSAPSSLAILKLEKASDIPNQPSALIQIGSWAYPLFTGQTTILKNELGIYVLPNPTNEMPDMFVGIILPTNLEERLEQEFIYVLNQFSILKLTDKMNGGQQKLISEKIAEFLIKSGDFFAQKVSQASEKTCEIISEKSEKYRATIPERLDPPININPAIRHGVFVLHKGSKVFAKVTNFLLNKIGEVGEGVGRRIANSVSAKTTDDSFVKGTINVIGGGVLGLSNVWITLENASKTLCKNFANEMVQIVQTKYGDQASETTHHALYATGHTTLSTFYLSELGVRSIAGRMTRKAGIQFLNSSLNEKTSKDISKQN